MPEIGEIREYPTKRYFRVFPRFRVSRDLPEEFPNNQKLMSDAIPQLAIFAFALLNFASPVSAQIHIGTVNGIVVDPNDARLPGAKVILKNQFTKFRVSIVSDSEGKFVFNNVPIDAYEVTVEAAGFQKLTRTINVRSNLPILIELKVSVTAASETVTVKDEQNNRDILIDPNATGSELKLNASFINSLPSATRSLSLQRIIATGPGWTTQNNGLMHIRGVDDGVLYVVDGIPTADRLDLVSAGSFDTGMIESLQIITGNIPAEFGGRSGAVVTIQPKSGIDLPWQGSLGSGFGNFGAREIEGRLGGNISQKFGIYLAASAIRSNRYLDPIDLGNFNNRGGTVKLNLRGDWHPAARDIVLLSAGANGSDFRVTNREEQELAGQRQRQELRDQSLSLGWQRIWSPKTVSNLAYFGTAIAASCLGPNSTRRYLRLRIARTRGKD
jgi:Carboxypeptidase regulatory-like domain/TonB-dependent Receptor Plug Domain